VLIDRPAVGAHLREHRVIFMQYGLKATHLSHNREFRGVRLIGNVLKYALTRRGVMALGAFEAGGFVKTRPDLALPDAQLLMSPFSLALGDRQVNSVNLEETPGLQCIALPLRPASEGFLGITAADPGAPLEIVPNFLSTEADRVSAIGAVRFVRRLFEQSPLKDLVTSETAHGLEHRTDDEILRAFQRFGGCGYHAVGTCRMGADEDSVTDPALRVRGITGLRVVDCSVMPTIPSGNTNGPVMALAWRAADLILEDAAA
jgi:choline dehydrogenase